MTNIEVAALKLLIKFAWGTATGNDYFEARKLVVQSLALSDERPLDVQNRKDALNKFLGETLV